MPHLSPACVWGPRPSPCLRVGTPPLPRLHVGTWLLERVTFPSGRPLGASPAEGTRCHGPSYPVSPLSSAGSQGGAKQAAPRGTGSSTPAIRLASGTWWAQALSPAQSFATPWTVATSSSVHGLLQASILGWAAISCFRGLGRGAHSQELSERREGSVSAAVTVSPHRRRPRQWGSSATPGLGSPAHQPRRPFPEEPEGPLSWALELPGRPRARLHSAALSLTLSPSFWGPGYGGGLISAILGGLGSLAQRS